MNKNQSEIESRILIRLNPEYNRNRATPIVSETIRGLTKVSYTIELTNSRLNRGFLSH